MLRKPIIYLSCIVLIVLIGIEVGLRLIGYKTLPVFYKVISTPTGFIIPDSIIGYTFKEGQYKVNLQNNFVYHATYINNGERLNPVHCSKSNAKEIFIYGCSFFGGWGVDDSLVMSSYLQKNIPGMRVRNFAVPGHGLTTQYLLLKEQVKKKTAPSIAVFEMASFHTKRNVAARSLLRSFPTRTDYLYTFPKAKISNNKLEFSLVPFLQKPCNLDRYFVTVATLEAALDKRYDAGLNEAEVESALIDSIAGFSSDHNIIPVFMCIYIDQTGENVKKHLNSRGYFNCSASINYFDKKYNLEPHDSHPNAIAHSMYADSIYFFLKNNNLIE